MSETALPGTGRNPPGVIGPNAILQLLPVLERDAAPGQMAELMARAGLTGVPDGQSMVPQSDAARLHQQVRLDLPDRAPQIAAQAGYLTANYILAHRIPPLAQKLLRLMPAPLAARALSRAITRHAWTFAGTGRFRATDPWHFEIANNPIVQGEHSTQPLCHWHAAVFARLYGALVDARCSCVETDCCAQDASETCRFHLWIDDTRPAAP